LSPLAEIRSAADGRADAIIGLASALVRIPSDAPAHLEAAVVDALRLAALELGLPAGLTLASQPGRPNLLVEIPFGLPGPRILLTGHTDTKPAGDLDAWMTDPWSGSIIDGRLVGLGSGDMKAALAAMLHAAAILVALERPPRGGIVLAFTSDEEDAGQAGLRALLDMAEVTVDGAILGEPAGVAAEFDQIGLASRGYFGFALRVRGSQAHSSLADAPGIVNPVQKLTALVTALYGRGLLREAIHPLFPMGATVNIATTIGGGVASGVIPAEAFAQGDIRMLPGMTPDDASLLLSRALDECRAADPDLDVQLEPHDDDWPGAEVSLHEPLARAVMTAAADVLGRPVAPGGFAGGTEAHLLGRRGIPTVPAAGPGVLDRAHSPNEWVRTAAVVDSAAIYALAAYRFLEGESGGSGE
jgi:succinyl-diaminopimelate desuccinylase